MRGNVRLGCARRNDVTSRVSFAESADSADVKSNRNMPEAMRF